MKPNKKFSLEIIPDFLMERFSNLFNSYTKAYNKTYNRKGSLFIDYLKRVELKDEAQFGTTIFYIHKNPVHHQYCQNITDWKWSSYLSLLSTSGTNLLRTDVIKWFGNEEAYVKFHQQPIYLKQAVIIE
jgi:putative transposase